MNRDDPTKENADLATNEILATEATAMPRDASTPWDPHEVWLTRVKLPRSCAALKLGADGVSLGWKA